MLTAAELLTKCQRPVEKITVPQWGEVYIRGLSAAEYDVFEAAGVREVDGKRKYVSHTPTLIRFGVVDADGKHVFSDSNLTELASIPAIISRPLELGILKLSGIGTDLGKS